MNIAEFFLGSIPLLLQFYAEMYRETDLKNTMVELESELNVPKVKSYDFIIGEFLSTLSPTLITNPESRDLKYDSFTVSNYSWRGIGWMCLSWKIIRAFQRFIVGSRRLLLHFREWISSLKLFLL